MKTRSTFLIIITLLIISTSFPITIAWDDCPFGIGNDPFPGLCGRYVDTNEDGICDRSQEEPESLETSLPSESSDTTENQSLIFQASAGKPLLENDNVLYLLISFFITFFLAIDSYFLSKKNKKLKFKIRILWNIALLIVFIPSAITGILIILFPNFPVLLTLDANFIKLHTISSFFFMWISAYHIIWHTSYYIKSAKNLMK